uniref:hypothetical protein n=1 Tax=Methylomonas sp. SPW-1 TaxID=3438877 RepID=UPI00402B2C0F
MLTPALKKDVRHHEENKQFVNDPNAGKKTNDRQQEFCCRHQSVRVLSFCHGAKSLPNQYQTRKDKIASCAE